MLPIWLNWAASMLWAYSVALLIALAVAQLIGLGPTLGLPRSDIVPRGTGLLLAIHYLLQVAVAVQLDAPYERRPLRWVFWVVWYPAVFWLLQAATAVVGLPRAMLRRSHGVWTSPDRGFAP